MTKEMSMSTNCLQISMSSGHMFIYSGLLIAFTIEQ